MAQREQAESAVVVVKAYDFTLWLLPKVEKFARSYRFSIGDRLVGNGLDLLLLLVESDYSQNKGGLLQQANLKVSAIRYLLRLSKDLKCFGATKSGLPNSKMESS
jgi:hypothetical protein